ncbi:MAG: DegT/DnrJ/EryC1/StrS family aminotransferase [Candidatus Neomarinimicrobiota bacterium]
MENLSKKYNLPLIYDAAPAIGVKINGESILKYGDISVVSFHATKVLNTFEGGAIISKTKKIKDKIDKIKNFGIVDEETVSTLGINGKMSEINAAMGILQLKHFNEIINARKNIFTTYKKGIKNSENYNTVHIKNGLEYNYSYFPIFFKKEKILEIGWTKC